MRILLACLLWAFLAVAAQSPAAAPATQGTPVHNIRLTGARDLADAVAVNRAITVMVRNAASCSPVTTQGAQPCACGFTDDLKILKNAYEGAVAKHPGWDAEGSVVAYVDSANGKSVSINLPGVKRQLDACSQRSRPTPAAQ
jgi:hypothetical protein